MTSSMSLQELIERIRWDMRMNRGWAFEQIRAKALTIEFRLEPVSYTHLTLPTICSV